MSLISEKYSIKVKKVQRTSETNQSAHNDMFKLVRVYSNKARILKST